MNTLPSLDELESLDWSEKELEELDLVDAVIYKDRTASEETVSAPHAMEAPIRAITPPPPETCSLSLDMSFSEVFEKYLNRAPEESPEESSVPVDSSPPEQEVSPSHDATNAPPPQDPLTTQATASLSVYVEPLIDLSQVSDPPRTSSIQPTQPEIQTAVPVVIPVWVVQPPPRTAAAAAPTVEPHASRDTAPAQKRRRSQPVSDAVGNKENQPPVTKRRRVDAVRQSSDLRPQLMPQQSVLAAPAPVSCAPSPSLVQLSRRLQRRLKDVQHYGPLARQLSDFYAKQAQNIEADRRKFLAACPAPERASHIHRFYDSSHSDLIQKIDARIEAIRREHAAQVAQQERLQHLMCYMNAQ
ncbi:hypothetical protein CAPTEDRAFT_188532 [Capitella teleta]|uniref:Uncharacterized protein n=1 Tax=Capitella teleta TaxID=283909 RepID=R7U0N7_CAPTE|nr:hypothetical protein CAPTEDRAFT_188532 [Capitella teleta]|eukprot:ELT99417.1 hypothetical protein CAPTEDRAFT_188532 [Capitella teleta]